MVEDRDRFNLLDIEELQMSAHRSFDFPLRMYIKGAEPSHERHCNAIQAALDEIERLDREIVSLKSRVVLDEESKDGPQ